jgi:hypothetical protein
MTLRDTCYAPENRTESAAQDIRRFALREMYALAGSKSKAQWL